MMKRRRLLLFSCLIAGLVPALALAVILSFPGPARARYEIWQGSQRLTGREYGAALRHFSAAAEATPSDPAPRLHAAAVYWGQGQVVQAEAEWQAALERDHDNAEALLGLGRVAVAQQHAEAAVFFFSSAALAKAPALVEARAGLAEGLAAQGDFAAARDEWQRLLASPGLRPDLQQQAHYQSALLLLADDPDAAVRELRLAQAVGSSAVAADRLADALNAAAVAGRAKAAVDGGDDRDVVAYGAALLGYTFLRAGKLDWARVQLERAVALRPDYGDALAYLGYVYWQQGVAPTALAVLQRAAAASPLAVLPHYFEGLVWRAEQRFDEAAAAMEAAVRLDPANSALHLELARTHVAGAEYAAAAQSYEQAAALSPRDAPLLLDVASFYLEHLFRVDRGLSVARQAAGLAPDSAAAHDALGWALHLNGDDAGALVALRRALTVDPSLAGAQYHLAVVYEQSGDHAAAAAAYRRVLDLDTGRLGARARAALQH